MPHQRPATAPSAPSTPADEPLPQTREELLVLHAQTRRRRNAASHSSPEHVAAVDLLGRIEIRVAAIDRSQDPPLG